MSTPRPPEYIYDFIKVIALKMNERILDTPIME